jgi:cellobiose-specific phosphotransferase system component IIC
MVLNSVRVTPHGKGPTHRVASNQKWMANDFPSRKKHKLYDSIIHPGIGSAIWIGGGGVGLLLVIVIVVLLLC